MTAKVIDHRSKLGATGIEISRAILGCGTFGGIGGSRELIGQGLDEESAFAALDEALALGINVLDTAERYASGASERIIGAWMAQQPSQRREALHIASKVAPPRDDGVMDQPFDARYISHKLDTSLERLGVSSVTYYMSHAPDPSTPIEVTLDGFAAVVESGRARHIGCCNVTPSELLEALETSERQRLPCFEWVQNGYSLLSLDDHREVRAICQERGLGFTPFSPLAGGVLSGKYKRDTAFPPGTRMALRPDGVDQLLTAQTFDALDRLRDMADAYGVSSAGLALAWILARRDCDSPVVGPRRSAPHLAHVREALSVNLREDDAERLAAYFLDR